MRVFYYRKSAACTNTDTTTASTAGGAPEQDAISVGYGILGFFFPIVGLILFFVWISSFPLRAKSAGIGALIGFVSNIVIGILGYFLVWRPLLSSLGTVNFF